MNIKTAKYLVSFALALWASALSAQTHWSVDCHRYQYDMTVYFVLKDGSRIVESQDAYEVAAFVGDECRGVASLETQTGSNGTTLTYGLLRIYSNVAAGETVAFRFFDKEKAEEHSFEDSDIPFVANSVVGLPSSPMQLAVSTLLMGDVNEDGIVNVADVSAVINNILGRANGAFNDSSADMNGDGIINVADVSAIINHILGK